MDAVKFKRSDCAILPLVLKAYWFNMIACGGKREEYRLATGYWQRRLWNWNRAFRPGRLAVVEFRLGYAATAPRMAFWPMGLETASGMLPFAFVEPDSGKLRHPEWGEPADAHFVIELGGRVELEPS